MRQRLIQLLSSHSCGKPTFESFTIMVTLPALFKNIAILCFAAKYGTRQLWRLLVISRIQMAKFKSTVSHLQSVTLTLVACLQ